MYSFFLDLSTEPTFFEKSKQHIWLIVISMLALVGIILFFIWRKKKKNNP